MFYNKQIYRGKRQARPVVEVTENYLNNTSLDKDLARLLKILPQRNIANRETCFWIDDICQSFAYMSIYTILGRGFRVNVEKNKTAEEKIRNFNRNINVNGDTINDYIIDVWIDNFVHAFSLWRIAKEIKGFDDIVRDAVDIQRLPPSTIQTFRDQINGWKKFVQNVTPFQTYKSPDDFLKENIPTTPLPHAQVVIPDDPRLCLHLSFFKRPPMDAAIPYIVIKYWILVFIRKYGEKAWAPLTIATVGNKDGGFPNGKIETEEALEGTLAQLDRLKNFSNAAFHGNTSVEVHELQDKGNAFLGFMDKMDQHIMYALFSSMATRESPGVYKGNEMPGESTVGFMEGVRTKIENELKTFYINNITPEIEADDIKFSWPELRTTDVNSMVGVLELAVKSGVFRDAMERRRAFAQIIPFLSDVDLTEEEAKRLDDELVTLLAPSQPGVTSADAAKGKGKGTGSTARKPN